MNAIYNALIVPAQLIQPVRIECVDTAVPVLQKLVAGNIEAIAGSNWHAYLNDEGYRLPQNDRAEVLIREAGVDLDDFINGRVVFLGHGPRGEEANVPFRLIRLAEQLFDLPLAA
ncbi:hypothetical protein [Arthrobacter sp. UYEF3]|uniref:DUF3846 domain-containing protein n=1 Tax=Arthrobacter sp. UYEF3 TaxID=1756365 RepID=UPI00339A9CA6